MQFLQKEKVKVNHTACMHNMEQSKGTSDYKGFGAFECSNNVATHNNIALLRANKTI